MHPDVPKFYSNHANVNSSEHDFTINYFDVDQDFKPEINKESKDGIIFAKPIVRVVLPISLLIPLAKAMQEHVEKHFAKDRTKD